MPVYPVARGESRLYMHRIEKDWYSLMNVVMNGSAQEAEAARKQLREELLSIAPVFTQKPFFLSDEFSLVDRFGQRGQEGIALKDAGHIPFHLFGTRPCQLNAHLRQAPQGIP